jgi:nucleoid-associated protein YgaU
MWLTYNGETEKLRFPVLPETIRIQKGGANQSVGIQGLGEVVIKQDPAATVLSFSGFFPATPFPGVQFEPLKPPETLKDQIVAWKDGDKPVHFLITGTSVNLFCVIEDFTVSEQGGDIGTIHYSLTLKEYKEVNARQVKVDIPAKKAYVPAPAPARTDNRAPERTYTVVKGDCLWNIAAKHLGSGSRYTEIYDLNRDIIKNPNLIFPGQVLKLP